MKHTRDSFTFDKRLSCFCGSQRAMRRSDGAKWVVRWSDDMKQTLFSFYNGSAISFFLSFFLPLFPSLPTKTFRPTPLYNDKDIFLSTIVLLKKNLASNLKIMGTKVCSHFPFVVQKQFFYFYFVLCDKGFIHISLLSCLIS